MSEDEKLNPDKVEPKEFNKDQLGIPSNLRGPTPIKGKLDVEQLIFKQIERTAQSAIQDESLFAANVRLLMSMLPQYKRDELKGMSDEYTSTSQTYQYKYFCGVPLGTPDHPINGSPALTDEETIDWHKLFEMIMHAFEEIGYTFKIDSQTVEIMPQEDAKEYLPEPSLPDQTTTPQSTTPTTSTSPTDEKRHYNCPICQQHIQHGTGERILDPRTGKMKTVHKGECSTRAKQTWVLQNP